MKDLIKCQICVTKNMFDSDARFKKEVKEGDCLQQLRHLMSHGEKSDGGPVIRFDISCRHVGFLRLLGSLLST